MRVTLLFKSFFTFSKEMCMKSILLAIIEALY